jgi:Cu(I)/Ag(I) efflux system membrane fusion protein
MSNSQPKSRRLAWILIVSLISLTAGVYVFTRLGTRDTNGLAIAADKDVYSCPMHPQVRQDHSGKCPICGMNLVKSDSAETQSVSANSTPTQTESPSTGAAKYQCPMHPTIVRDRPGDCPICGMKLVKMKSASKDPAVTTSSAATKKISFYRSPMDPKQTSPTPRKDEMGMDYVPVYEEEVSSGGSDVPGRAEINIDPSRQQIIGLRTAPVTRSEIQSEWQTVGRVQADPTKIRRTNIKVPGYVERVFVDFVGKPVARGEALFTYYSPDLLAAQKEYLLAIKSNHSGGDTSIDSLMISVVRQKLKLWDVSDAQLDRLQQTGEVTKALTFVSPVSGVVTAKNVVEGSSLMPGDAPYEITDLSSVWVIADAYQSDAQRAKVGVSATVTLESLPDRVFKGAVAFVDPIVDPQSRTIKVRINVDNIGGELKPDMFAEVTLQGSAHESLTIPADALIPTGRGNMVFVDLGNGKFQPRAVTIGGKSGDRVEVSSGLQEGESVVMRANFLVDSESSLRAALAAVGGN